MTSKQRHPGMPFVLLLVFIDMLSMGVVFPVLPMLIGAHTPTPRLQSYWFGALAASYGLMQFLAAPLLGALSDRFGRRPVLLLSITGMALDNLLLANASSLWLMLLARLIGGVTGAGYSVASAYAADVTPPQDRAKAFGMLGAAFGMGFIIGPVVGGFLGDVSITLPFYVAAGLAGLNALYGLFILPESLSKENRAPLLLERVNPFAAPLFLARRRGIGGVVFVWTIFQVTMAMVVETWVLYAHFRYGWGTRMNGFSLFCVGVATAIVQGGLIAAMTKRFGDERTVLIGLMSGAFGYALYGVATHGWMLFPIIFGTLAVFATGPALMGIVSRQTEPTEQGITMGALNSLRMAMVVVGPAIGVPLLGQVAHLPSDDPRLGVVFFACAGLQLVAWLIASRHFNLVRSREAVPAE